MIDLRWHGRARTEASAAAAFYQGKRPGLAQHLRHSLEDTLHRIRRQPLVYPQIEGGMYKCRLPHFPYGIVYRMREGYIEILAVMHLRKAPRAWNEGSGSGGS